MVVVNDLVAALLVGATTKRSSGPNSNGVSWVHVLWDVA